jgi:hypothetical protein
VVGIAALLSSTTFAATGSDQATASLTIDNVISVILTWQSSGASHADLGTVATDDEYYDVLVMDVSHNMGASQTFMVSAVVDKTTGADWESFIYLIMVSDFLYWGNVGSPFGSNLDFPDYVGGSSEIFQETINAGFSVDSHQPNGTYNFEFTIILTSL